MALRAILESLDDLDESLHEHYTQAEDGTFVLDLGETFRDHPGAHGLKSALDKERDTRKAHDKTIADLQRKIDAGGGDTAELQAQLDEAKRQLEEADATIAEKDKAHNRALNDHDTTLAAMELGLPKMALSYMREKLAYDENGRAFVPDEHGAPAIDAAGDPVTITDFFVNLAENDPEIAPHLPSKMKNGAGTPPGDRTGTGVKNKDTNKETAPPPRNSLEAKNRDRRARIDAFRDRQQQR